MTVEFGTIHHYFNLVKYSGAWFVQLHGQIKRKITENNEIVTLLVKSGHILTAACIQISLIIALSMLDKNWWFLYFQNKFLKFPFGSCKFKPLFTWKMKFNVKETCKILSSAPLNIGVKIDYQEHDVIFIIYLPGYILYTPRDAECQEYRQVYHWGNTAFLGPWTSCHKLCCSKYVHHVNFKCAMCFYVRHFPGCGHYTWAGFDINRLYLFGFWRGGEAIQYVTCACQNNAKKSCF